MIRFTQLFEKLDTSNSTADKINALKEYFGTAPSADAAWALAILTGRRVKGAVSSRQMRVWLAEVSGYPDWLIDECYEAVGDFAETLSLLVPDARVAEPLSLAQLVNQRIVPMARASEADRRLLLRQTWAQLDRRAVFLFHKLISGTFRVGVSRQLTVRAMASAAGVPQEVMDRRLTGAWEPTAEFFESIMSVAGPDTTASLNPYPFFLAHQVPQTEFIGELLGDVREWAAEWKWNGIRAQIVRRGGRTAIWSRGEELISHQFPEVVLFTQDLPDGTVLDGELLAWERDRPLPFALLQTRIASERQPARLFPDVPVAFCAYDLLELDGEDQRTNAFEQRRRSLERIFGGDSNTTVFVSPLVTVGSWDGLERLRGSARERGVEGLVLKHRASAYGVGRTRVTLVGGAQGAGWWKWKVDPHSIDCVLTAAQRGSGRRASLFTDYSFAVWSGPEPGSGELVTIAKAYSGLNDQELLRVDAFVRENTTGRFPGGGGRTVAPTLVFEIAFDSVAVSPRHKSGVATRFPRIARWRTDKVASQADTLASVKALIPPTGASHVPA